MLHSVWALATGVAVILLARGRYGFVPWVVLFLVVTWASTLFFGRRATRGANVEGAVGIPGGAPRGIPGLGDETTSYVTRTMYQETLFFLLPFYAYSTDVTSPNVIFLGALAALGVLSCLDLLFDLWLRSSAVFSMAFFAIVAFAAINLILPILAPIEPTVATRLAAVVSLASALPLALHGPVRGAVRWRIAAAAAAFLAAVTVWPHWIPPVPLRVESAVFASAIDRETLVAADTLADGVDPQDLAGALFVRLEIFAPSAVPTNVSLEWTKDGRPFRLSREVAITAHEIGFRLWDGFRLDSTAVEPGRYRVTVRASGGRVFGRADLRVGAAGRSG